MLLPLAAIIVGPASVAVILVRADSSELVTKEPVAPESKIAYQLEIGGGTKSRLKYNMIRCCYLCYLSG